VTNHLRQALRDADWEAILPGLFGYAANRLRRVGWAAGRDEEPSKLSVEQLVNMAVEACLDGSRAWNPATVDFPGFLRGVIRSLTSSEKKSAVRSKTHAQSDFERIVPLAPSPEDEAIEEEGRKNILGTIERAIGGDADLRAIYEAILDGAVKREEIAASLGWSVDRVSAARIKLQRRLVRLSAVAGSEASTSPTPFAPALEKRRRTS
jgi:hypothetical protein